MFQSRYSHYEIVFALCYLKVFDCTGDHVYAFQNTVRFRIVLKLFYRDVQKVDTINQTFLAFKTFRYVNTVPANSTSKIKRPKRFMPGKTAP